jgi:hypothetical protein
MRTILLARARTRFLSRSLAKPFLYQYWPGRRLERSEQQSGSSGADSAGRGELNAPLSSLTNLQLTFKKEMLVGAVGIELKARLMPRRLIPQHAQAAQTRKLAKAGVRGHLRTLPCGGIHGVALTIRKFNSRKFGNRRPDSNRNRDTRARKLAQRVCSSAEHSHLRRYVEWKDNPRKYSDEPYPRP